MKILFIADDIPPQSHGGAGIITYALAKAMRERGQDISFITTVTDKAKEGRHEADGMHIFSLYADYNPAFSTYISLWHPSAIKQVRRLIAEIQPEIIHVHNVHHYLSYGVLKIARQYTNKVFLTTHDAMAFNYGKLINYFDKNDLSVHTDFSYRVSMIEHLKKARFQYNPFRNLFIRKYLNSYPKKIFAISERLKQALMENGINGERIQTIHYGIDIRNWQVSDRDREAFIRKQGNFGKKIIFFGGRLSDAKGGRAIIRAMEYVVMRDDHTVLLIAGTENDYTESLLSEAREKGIGERIKLAGWLSRDDMKSAYAAASVVVTPSVYFDAFNLFNIEAGAAARPVVGTCFGGTPEIILDGVTGLIVNPLNAETMGKALLSLLGDPAYAKRLGQAGFERVNAHFGIDRYIDETLACYTS